MARVDREVGVKKPKNRPRAVSESEAALAWHGRVAYAGHRGSRRVIIRVPFVRDGAKELADASATLLGRAVSVERSFSDHRRASAVAEGNVHKVGYVGGIAWEVAVDIRGDLPAEVSADRSVVIRLMKR